MSESASIEAEDVKNVKSSIEQIPRELIWKIIEYAPETVNNMRLSCSTLRNRVEEYAREPVTIQLVDNLTIFVEHSMRNYIRAFRDTVRVTVKPIPDRTALFQLRFNALKTRLNYVPRIERGYGLFHFYISGKGDDQLWLEIVKEWIGKRINKAKVDRSLNCKDLAISGQLLKEIDIDHLSFCAKTLGEDALNFLRMTSADHLFLNVCKVETSAESGSVLLELSAMFRSIHILHNFFGVSGHSWAPVIVGMFSGKLNMLRIENHSNYLSRIDEETLIERLTTTCKPIWFQTTIASADRVFDRDINEHCIKRRKDLLTIMHHSLKNGPKYFSAE